jgi:predicted acyl esterase
VFDSTPLEHPFILVGAPVAHLRVARSASDGNLVVHLADLAPDGTSSIISSRWLRASHRLSHETPELLSPGRTYDVDVREHGDSRLGRRGLFVLISSASRVESSDAHGWSPNGGPEGSPR